MADPTVQEWVDAIGSPGDANLISLLTRDTADPTKAVDFPPVRTAPFALSLVTHGGGRGCSLGLLRLFPSLASPYTLKTRWMF